MTNKKLKLRKKSGSAVENYGKSNRRNEHKNKRSTEK